MVFGHGYRESTVSAPRRVLPIAIVRTLRFIGYMVAGTPVLACVVFCFWLAGPGATLAGFKLGRIFLGHEFQHGWAEPPGELGAWGFGLLCITAPVTTAPLGRMAVKYVGKWLRT